MYICNQSYENFISLRDKNIFDFDGQNITLTFLRRFPKEAEIKAFSEDEIFFQLFVRNEILFLLLKVGQIPWLDIPFVLHHKVKNLEQNKDEILCGCKCRIYFANAISGKLLVIKDVILPLGISKAFYWEIKKQIETLPKDLTRRINKVHASFSSDEMVRLSLEDSLKRR